ncbi:MAG TPA: sugar phosphate isomerase/epimerase family protein [Puia sp.]|jgi:sugar phosphate isomerase/epimerase|nr:sugar phosphate isomerase/epimerase family protein [Puia sp.]
MKRLFFCCLFGLSALLYLTGYRYPATNSSPLTTHSPDANSPIAASSIAPKDWKIGVQLWTFHFVPFVNALDKADSAGIKYLEAFPGQPLGGGMKDTFGIRMSEESREKIKQLLHAKGMQIIAMGVIVPRTISEWKQYFDLAKYFGLSYITAEPLKNQWDAIDSLAAIYNINIAIHDHPRPNAYWHPDSVLAASKGHPHIGSCADIGHWARNGLDPVVCLQELEGHIFGVHLKDIDTAGHTRAKDMVVGTGVINYPPIFRELKRQGFKGMFSIEREANWYNNVPDVIATVKFFNGQVSKL